MPLSSHLRSLVFLLLLIGSCHAVAGDYAKKEVTIGDEKREYYVYEPKALKGKKNRPAIIAFHGYKSDANGFRWLISPDKWADKHGFVMIYPNAIKKSWNAGKGMGRQNKTSDDAGFAAALPKLIVERHDIAKDQIYAMGFSNGAQVVAKLLCHHADQIAGAAMVAQSLNEDNCQPSHKVPVVMMHGMQDRAAPYKGGGKFELRSHKDSLAFFKTQYGINAKKATIKEDKTFKCSQYKDNDKTAIVGCSMYNDGHQWPGSRDFMVKELGTTNKNLSANDFIMRFFKQYQGTAPATGKPATQLAKQVKTPAKATPATKPTKTASAASATSTTAKTAPKKADKQTTKPQANKATASKPNNQPVSATKQAATKKTTTPPKPAKPAATPKPMSDTDFLAVIGGRIHGDFTADSK